MIRHGRVLRFLFVVFGACACALVLSAHDAKRADALTVDAQPVTNVVAPVVNTATAPVTNTVAPVVDTATTPVTKTVAPVVHTVAPVVNAVTAPVVHTVAPVVQTVAPVVNTVTAPVVQTIAPVVQTVAPVTKPVTDAVAPIVDTVAPAPMPAPPVTFVPVSIPDAPTVRGLSTTHRTRSAGPQIAAPHLVPIAVPSVVTANVAIPHVAVRGAVVRSTLRKAALPVVPKSVPELPTTRDVPSSGSGNPFPGSLAVLVAAAAAASLVATRLRSATTVWPSLLYASLIERPG